MPAPNTFLQLPACDCCELLSTCIVGGHLPCDTPLFYPCSPTHCPTPPMPALGYCLPLWALRLGYTPFGWLRFTALLLPAHCLVPLPHHRTTFLPLPSHSYLPAVPHTLTPSHHTVYPHMPHTHLVPFLPHTHPLVFRTHLCPLGAHTFTTYRLTLPVPHLPFCHQCNPPLFLQLTWTLPLFIPATWTYLGSCTAVPPPAPVTATIPSAHLCHACQLGPLPPPSPTPSHPFYTLAPHVPCGI